MHMTPNSLHVVPNYINVISKVNVAQSETTAENYDIFE